MIANITEKAAIAGGPKAKKTPFGPRKRHGERDKELLRQVIDSDLMFFYIGTKVREFERRFAELYGRKHCVACSSGTAAVHIALGALEMPTGSEVITTSITDMGSTTGIVYQGLVPVFADVDPETLNMSVESVCAKITERTRAILLVHHAGLAADTAGMETVAREYGIPVIEDCAQAYGCEFNGALVGKRGIMASFSLNHFKHITCGSGGTVLTDDDRLRYVATLFLDKCYQRDEGIRDPFFLAPNYQMTELQGAVALAQLEKLEEFTGRRTLLGSRLDAHLRDIDGVSPQRVDPGRKHSYFLYLFQLDLEQLRCTAEEFSTALAAEGIPNKAHLITGGMPVYHYRVFRDRSAFPGTHYPFEQLDKGVNAEYRVGDCPNAEAAFDRWIVVDFNESFTGQDIDEIAEGIAKVAAHYRR